MKIPKEEYVIRIYREYDDNIFKYKWEVNTNNPKVTHWQERGWTITRLGAMHEAKRKARKHYKTGMKAVLVKEILYP